MKKLNLLLAFLLVVISVSEAQAEEKWTCGYTEYKQILLEKDVGKNTYSAYILTRNYTSSGSPITDREELATNLSCSWSSSEPRLFYCEIKKPNEISASLVVSSKIINQTEMVGQLNDPRHLYESQTYEVHIRKFDFDVSLGDKLIMQIPVEAINVCRSE